jgi:hypothetical protein
VLASAFRRRVNYKKDPPYPPSENSCENSIDVSVHRAMGRVLRCLASLLLPRALASYCGSRVLSEMADFVSHAKNVPAKRSKQPRIIQPRRKKIADVITGVTRRFHVLILVSECNGNVTPARLIPRSTLRRAEKTAGSPSVG